MKITRPTRSFVEQNLKINAWEDIAPYYKSLQERELDSREALEKWLSDQSELEAILEEDLAWRYVRMTIDTRDEDCGKAYNLFVTEIQPKIAPFEDELNKKLMACPFVETLEADPAYAILLRRVRCALDLYREENITLQAEESEESQKFGAISAAQSIEQNGKTLTMQQAGLLLKEPDEALRKTVFDKMTVRRAEDIEPLHALFDQLLKIRHTIAINAGFENYRDYKMAAMGRFDYGVEDCFDFHRSIKECIVPIVKELQKEKLALLGKSAFKPWDLSVDPEGRLPLKPFEKGEELLAGSIRMFDRIDPYFGDCLRTMNEMQHLDLESKPGKAPGGYNYPLYEIGVPFIFMNAVGSQQDVVTMVHEGGHAVHSFLSRDLKLTGFKNLPSEVAELASMSMELLTMEHWNELYTDSSELLRAQKEQLESILKILPWIAQVDEFQHWLYTHPAHTHVERTAQWMELNRAYGTGLTDWSGYEGVQETSWQRQLHIFEVPFYYIEYGIAQLGALQVWMRSLENKTKAVEDYKNALRLAYTKSIPEIYATAGIKFDFSIGNLRDLAGFIDVKLKTLRA